MRMYEQSLVDLLNGPYGKQVLKLRLTDDVQPPTYRRKSLRGVTKRNAYHRGSDFARRFWHAIHEPHCTTDRAIVVIDDGVPVALAIKWDYESVEQQWRRNEANAGFYVRWSHRRYGLGKRLFKRALKLWEDVRICRHDKRSTSFFDRVGARP